MIMSLITVYSQYLKCCTISMRTCVIEEESIIVNHCVLLACVRLQMLGVLMLHTHVYSLYSKLQTIYIMYMDYHICMYHLSDGLLSGELLSGGLLYLAV